MKIVLFANTDWYLFNYRLPLARALRDLGHEVVLLSPPGRYVTRLEGEGFRWQSFPLEGKGTNPLAEIAVVARLARVLGSEKPDVLHNFTIKPMIYGSLVARMTGIRRVVNAVEGLGFVFSGGQAALRAVVTFLYRIGLRGTTVVFHNSDDREVFLKRHLIGEENAELIPSVGVDMDVFRAGPEPERDPVVMLTGRLLRSKGVPEFVEAAKRLRQNGVRARFVLVGGPFLDNPESVTAEEISDWEKSGWIEYWGWHDDMADVYPKAAVVCLPTAYKEGLPRSLLEAGACGRPVVATDIPGCRAIVRHGENGLLVEPHNVDALVEALKTLLNDRALRQTMGLRGREIVGREFSVETIIARTLRLYDRKR